MNKTFLSKAHSSLLQAPSPPVSNQTETNPVIEILTDSGLIDTLYSPLSLSLLIGIAGLVWVSVTNGRNNKGNKHKLARARWAGEGEKKTARKMACSQMEKRKHNQVSLYISRSKVEKPVKAGDKYLIQIPESTDRLYFPDAQRGVLVCGSPGSGKTYSVINPLIRSAIDQGFSLVLYDLKYHQLKSSTDKAMGQTAKLAGYALERGYKVKILAPGFKESCTANPLDFLESENDAAMARQLAIALNKNLKLSSGDNDSNHFFPMPGIY